MTKTVKWLFTLIFQNFAWKLVSLALAVGLWLVVASEPELATFASVPLEYKNLPEDLEVSSEPLPNVTLELRGPSGELRDLGERGQRAAAILDMSNVTVGIRTFTIGGPNVKLPTGVRLERAIPSQVRYAFERRVVRNVPVVVRFLGEGQHGYVVAQQAVEPNQLTITGPSSHVARMAAVVTDPVDVSNTVGTAEFRANAYSDDPYVRFQTSPQVVVTLTMKKR
jgi:YbbR domain-containing protein